MYFKADSAVVVGEVEIGEGTNIWHQAVVRGDIGRIQIGDRTNIQDLCLIHVSHNVDTVIGDDVVVGHGCILHGCVIESNVLIGMGSIVMDHCQIGEGSVLGAGTLLLENTVIPSRSLVVGHPGKVIRSVTDRQCELTKKAADHYVEQAKASLPVCEREIK